MAQMARKFRYSPVNALIIDWSYRGRNFDDCGLPKGLCAEDPPLPDEVYCQPLPIEEAIDTYDWARWLPEVMVGIDDPNEEIAAAYVRETAIDFAKKTKVLRRNVYVLMCPNEHVYPVFPHVGERIVGVIRARTLSGQSCSSCKGNTGRLQTFDFEFRAATNEITIYGDVCGNDVLQIEVWSAPTEESCSQDAVLYDQFRQAIAMEARRRYAMAYHFNQAGLLRSLQSAQDFEVATVLAARSVVQKPASRVGYAGSTLWGGGCCDPTRGPYKGW